MNPTKIEKPTDVNELYYHQSPAKGGAETFWKKRKKNREEQWEEVEEMKA
jgi:hypothetical protein